MGGGERLEGVFETVSLRTLNQLTAGDSPLFDLIAFDADDTLWHNERLYADVQAAFARLLAQYQTPEQVHQRLYRTETRNLQHFGYGAKAFALSMIETAVEIAGGRIAGRDVQAIVDLVRGMLDADVALLDHVAETIPLLAGRYPLLLITKGDLIDQERKIARSGLAGYFRDVEVVSHKTRSVYDQLLARHGVAPASVLMVGNSLRSDILPFLELGGRAVYIPYELTWLHEVAEPPPEGTPGYHQLEHMGQLPALLEQLEKDGGIS